MGITLLEYGKGIQDPFQSAIVEMYASAIPLFAALPFTNISGNAYGYNREETLPGIGFRGVNESYTPSTGILNPMVEKLVIAGGEIDVDTFILETMGEGRRSVEEMMKIKALALSFYRAFIKGDSITDPRSLDGLQNRCVNDQLMYAGTTDGGDALSLAKLDEAIDRTYMPNAIAMSKTMRRRFSTAARASSISGNINYDQDAMGRRQMFYGELPIMETDYDNNGTQILNFEEVASTGATATAGSIYVLSIGDGMLEGIQSGPVKAEDLGTLQAKPAKRTRVEWYPGIMIQHGRAVTRLGGITNAAITA